MIKFNNRTEVTNELPIGCLLPFISLILPAATTAARYCLCTLARSGPACKLTWPGSPREQAASKIKPNSNFETNNELRHLLLKLQSFKWCNFLPRLNSKQAAPAAMPITWSSAKARRPKSPKHVETSLTYFSFSRRRYIKARLAKFLWDKSLFQKSYIKKKVLCWDFVIFIFTPSLGF